MAKKLSSQQAFKVVELKKININSRDMKLRIVYIGTQTEIMEGKKKEKSKSSLEIRTKRNKTSHGPCIILKHL